MNEQEYAEYNATRSLYELLDDLITNMEFDDVIECNEQMSDKCDWLYQLKILWHKIIIETGNDYGVRIIDSKTKESIHFFSNNNRISRSSYGLFLKYQDLKSEYNRNSRIQKLKEVSKIIDKCLKI